VLAAYNTNGRWYYDDIIDAARDAWNRLIAAPRTITAHR